MAVPDTHGPLFPGGVLPEPESLEALKDLRPLGQIHDSFIIAAGRDGLWIIDQHVAHERILFEQVLAARGRNAVETQGLLMPLVIQLTPAQQIEYARIAEELNALGFDTEPFGNRTVAVKSAPAGIGASDIEKVIFEILEISEQRTAQSIARRSAAQHGRIHRLPRRDQNQHAPGTRENGLAAARSRRDFLAHELPARAPDCAALLHSRYP